MDIIAVVEHCIQVSPDDFAMITSSLKCDEETTMADLWKWLNSEKFRLSKPDISQIKLTMPE